MIQRKKKKFISKKWVVRIIIFVALLIVFMPNTTMAIAIDGSFSNNDAEQNLTRSLDDILNQLDLSALERFIRSFDENQMTVFGQASATEKIRMIVTGQVSIDYGNFITYILEVLGISLLRFLPLMLGILAIAISINIIHSLKGKFASDSVGNIVSFVGIALTAAIVAAQLMAIIVSARSMINALQTQMNIVFPILLTLMAAAGGVSSAAVYQPAVAILSGGLMSMLSAAILPMFIVSNIFTVVGNLSDGVKLKKMSTFFASSSKWLLGTAFFLFIAFLSVQGITASIYDGVSVRTARFAIARYVPIIGGYLSEGFNLIMAGSVLVKNAVGFTAVIVLFLSVIPTIATTILFSLSLQLTAAIAEPLGEKRISNILSGVSKNMVILIAVLIGAAFLYFIFLILVIATGNPAL